MRYLSFLQAAALVLLSVRAEVPYAPGNGPIGDPVIAAQQIAARHTAGNFSPSLEAREAAEFLLAPALLLQSVKLDQPVQFDAVITLKRTISRSDVTLFARYWVASNFYGVGVVWAEPHGRFLEFAIYPPSLQIVSSDRAFTIYHSLFTNGVGSYQKPIPPQEVFTNQFGDYPIASIRFAEARASINPLFAIARKSFSTNSTGWVERTAVGETAIKLGLEKGLK